jgi:hypothetical protein
MGPEIRVRSGQVRTNGVRRQFSDRYLETAACARRLGSVRRGSPTGFPLPAPLPVARRVITSVSSQRFRSLFGRPVGRGTRTRSMRSVKKADSCCCLAVRRAAIGSSCPSVTRCISVENPPRRTDRFVPESWAFTVERMCRSDYKRNPLRSERLDTSPSRRSHLHSRPTVVSLAHRPLACRGLGCRLRPS